MTKSNMRLAIIAAFSAFVLFGCGFSSQSKLLCNGREQIVGPKSVQSMEVSNVIATLHKSFFGTSRSIEVRTDKSGWIDATYCYPSNQGDFFRGPGCNDYDTMIELDKQNGRLFVQNAPYRDNNNIVATDSHIVAEYFCRNADPIK